jgi:hypothetical protein
VVAPFTTAVELAKTEGGALGDGTAFAAKGAAGIAAARVAIMALIESGLFCMQSLLQTKFELPNELLVGPCCELTEMPAYRKTDFR